MQSQGEQAQAAQAAAKQAAEFARLVQAELQQPPVFVQVPGGGAGIIRSGAPQAIYEALRHQRRELNEQLDRLEGQRENITDQLRLPNVSGTDQKALESRLTQVDARITAVEAQIAESEKAVANAAAVPGAVVTPRPPIRQGPPEEVFVLTGVFMFIVILPLTIAYARRIWRRGAAVVSAIPQEIYDRFNRLDQAVDSVAIEVERIGEGQRFLTRVYAEQQKGLGAGPAERVEVAERERERQARK